MLNIDGVDIHLEGAAAGAGAHTVVMIHGWPDTYRLWDAQVAHLLEAFPQALRCVRFTLPGFDVAKPPRPMGLRQLVDFFAKVVDTVSPGQPVTLMLHDWGCVFGYEYLARHPSRVARLVAVDIGNYNEGELFRSLAFREKLFMAGYQLWLAAAWKAGQSLSRALGDRMTHAMVRAMRWRGDMATTGWQMNYPYYVQWTGAYGGARNTARVNPACPMLYLYGKRKPFQFQSQGWLDRMAAGPGFSAQAFETGHWVMGQKPEAFNRCVSEWLARTPVAPATAAVTPSAAP